MLFGDSGTATLIEISESAKEINMISKTDGSGFKAIIDGEMDEYPEAAFFNVGNLEDVIAKAKAMKE